MRYIIGLDGGGTTTKASLYKFDTSGITAVVSSIEVGPSNLNSAPAAEVLENLMQVSRSFDMGNVVATGFGVAGISAPGVREKIRSFLKLAGFPEPYVVVGDQEAALVGAIGDESGILLVAGTGSIGMAKRRDGSFVRAGGYGHLLDDEGSAYAVGRDLLAAWIRASDGRGLKTPILQELEEQLLESNLVPVDAIMKLAYGQPFDKGRIAAFARFIDDYIDIKDPIALRIADTAAHALCEIVETLAAQLNEDIVKLVLSGGMVARDNSFRRHFVSMLNLSDYRCEITGRKADAMAGAAELAWKRWRFSSLPE